jgi:hypothetical protein
MGNERAFSQQCTQGAQFGHEGLGHMGMEDRPPGQLGHADQAAREQLDVGDPAAAVPVYGQVPSLYVTARPAGTGIGRDHPYPVVLGQALGEMFGHGLDAPQVRRVVRSDLCDL